MVGMEDTHLPAVKKVEVPGVYQVSPLVHGGEIEVESEEGEGTTVRLYFPSVEKRVRLIEDSSPKPKSVIEV